ncbi:hypothetical protein IscW_ISCW008237 [Ixodes scapularis]|uniref:Uncharacterized protein n=1 Tax=Ixodes scapularis TaxID=6945 RepID=B7PS26_IXOSC|nr:hypothetical protein IscW_ISCW008237 [Ixodes scapularis]|eukprot:XP_002401780.1 hypothetical protein IscW_ISCW008237 [Ixodes scapularis]
MKVRFSNNNTVFDVITMLVDDCNRLDAEDAALGRCDTDFMTLRTVMPMETNEADDAAILDPSVSTTLKDHNDMIQRTFDTVPMIKRNKYFNALQNSNAVQTTVGVLNIAHVVQQCMSSSRTDKRFVELHRSTQGGSSELDRFFAQACSVSPRNLWLFLQCINFEMMDPETFGAMLYCLKVTNGIPTPDEREVAAYANSSLFRMAMNLFYHTRVCHSYKNDEVYLYDGMFFNHYLSWMHDVHYLEHHIPPSVAASIMSWCTSMSTALHTVRDADGTRQSMAALSVCEIDQRVLADFLKMFVKMYIEDETEITIINKKFLENELLKVFECDVAYKHLQRGHTRTTTKDDDCGTAFNVVFTYKAPGVNSIVVDVVNFLNVTKTLCVHDVICTKNHVYLYVRKQPGANKDVLHFVDRVISDYVNGGINVPMDDEDAENGRDVHPGDSPLCYRESRKRTRSSTDKIDTRRCHMSPFLDMKSVGGTYHASLSS